MLVGMRGIEPRCLFFHTIKRHYSFHLCFLSSPYKGRADPCDILKNNSCYYDNPALPSGILLSFPDLLLSFAYRTDLYVYLIMPLPQTLRIILVVWEHHVGELRYLHPRFRLTDYPCEVCISICTFRTRNQDRSFTATWAVVVIVPSAHTATHDLTSLSSSSI